MPEQPGCQQQDGSWRQQARCSTQIAQWRLAVSRRTILRVAIAALGLVMLSTQAPAPLALATPSIPIPPPVSDAGHVSR